MTILRRAVVLESLQAPLRAAIDRAATLGGLGGLGVTGVQVDAIGPLRPDQLGQTGRREFRALLRSRGLELAALGCPLAHGFDTGERLDRRVSHVKQVLSLAYELGARVVLAYPGRLDRDEKDPAWPFLFGSLVELARHGEHVGVSLALETGMEPPEQVATLVARFGPAGLGLNLDPANLILHRHDPATAARAWRERLLHVHARDARPGRPDRGGEEVPLGEGDVDWLALAGALEEVSYRGWLTIKRNASTDPLTDVRAGLGFLARILG